MAALTCSTAAWATTSVIQDGINVTTGIVSVFGDDLDNTITISRDAAGAILSNGVPIPGATVANTVADSRLRHWAATTPSHSTKPTAPCPPRCSSAALATTR